MKIYGGHSILHENLQRAFILKIVSSWLNFKQAVQNCEELQASCVSLKQGVWGCSPPDTSYRVVKFQNATSYLFKNSFNL